MARAIGRLTALKVDKAKEPGMYADGGGLYLRVTPEGARNWMLRYMLDRRPRWMGLGPLALYGLQEARAKALDARRKRHEGIDPIEARRAERARQRLDAAKAITFGEVAAALHRRAPRRMAQRQARGAVGNHAQDTCGADHVAASAGGGHCACRQSAGTDLDDAAGNGLPLARADRERFGLCQGAGVSRRRKSGALARPSRQVASGALQGARRRNITPPCPTPSCRPSWWPCARKRAFQPAHWNLPSSRPRAPAK